MSDGEDVAIYAGDLVVIGSSAGGIDALSILVNTLPKDFPAPIVLAQHLDPNRPSSLDAILQQRTSLQVEVVTSGDRLLPGKIYVVPSNRNVAIHDHCVKLQEDTIKRPKPSVDMLLTSAAQAYGEHLIAVILTGYGSDGAAGAVEVKNAGGTVIIQDPQTARYPSMPLALPPTVIDFKATIEQIGPLLYDLLSGVPRPQPEEKIEDQLHHILEFVSRQTSIDFHHYKTSTILRRIGRRMAITSNRTMSDYIQYLETHPDEARELVNAFLINVTQFFRDLDAFNYLKSDIFPALLDKAHQRNQTLRCWAAGCATGEEAYSLAMLIADLLGSELPEWNIKIFATDLDESAIDFARRGLYPESQLKHLPSEYLHRFFEHTEQGYRVAKILRQMVIFGRQDLSKNAPFPRIDLLLCRNVLIYFTPELQEFVLSRFAFSLHPGGYLFLGKAETVRPSQTYYELVNKHWKVYRCTDNALSKIPRPNLSERGKPRSQEYTTTIGKQILNHEPAAPLFELGQLRHFNELILRSLPIGVVAIDSSYHILAANGTARRLLGLHNLDSEQDFLHSVRNIPYDKMRTAIDTVFREKNTVTLSEVELDHTPGTSTRFLSISVAPIQIEAKIPSTAIISIMDITEQVQIRQQLEAAQSQKDLLLNDLSNSNKLLNELNKELLDANEKLQVANEELILTHEELQATSEEFETTNEELQATNEELETHNEELQATNEELETTNDELKASTTELQELTLLLENEKVLLAEMVELTPLDIMVLRGPNLVVETFSIRHIQQLEGRIIKGQPLKEIGLFEETDTDIVHLAQEAYQQDAVRITPRISTSLSNAQGETRERYLVYTIIPSHDVKGKVSGLVIYTEDVTEQRAKEIADEYEKLKLIFDHANMAALALYNVKTTELVMASPYYLECVAHMNEIESCKLIGLTWQESSKIVLGEQATILWDTVLKTQTGLRLPEIHFQHKGQETIWDWSLTPILDTEKPDTMRFILVSAIDITEQVLARYEKLKLIFDHAYMSTLALYDAKTTKLIMASPYYLESAARMNGIEPCKLIGLTWQESNKAMLGEQTTILWNTALETQTVLRLPEIHFQYEGRESIWDWSLTSILDTEQADTIRFILVSAIDITEQASARQEMEQLSSLKDEFLSVASHELRTPLTTILGSAEILRRKLRRQATEANQNGVEQKNHILEGIIHQVNRMTKLIDEMLDVTRLRQKQFALNKTENVNIVELVRRTIEQQAVTTNRSLILNTPQETIIGTWDEARLEQVLTNLISNAIKYSQPDQPITIGIELRPDSTQPSEVVVLVQDQGPGISEEEQAHIFDRYHRGQAHDHPDIHGLGLGLHIAREIVTLHGGRIWLDSQPGEGSTFYFSLPLRP